MRESGEALVQRLGITKGLKVLDLGCGDGTTALPAAKLGADVLGIDIARNLVEAGNKRAAEHGLTNLKFQEGDASNLEQVPDKSFDLVVSIFGAMFAPKPFDVAKEMVRVTRPGGRIVMGNWIPNDPTLVAQILKISSNYTPPPPEGFVSPMTWGVESNVIERFTAAGVPKENISFARDTFTFNFPGTPSQFVDEFRKYYGPTMNAFEAAEKQGRAAELQKQLEELVQQPKQKSGRHVHSCNVPARDGREKVRRKVRKSEGTEGRYLHNCKLRFDCAHPRSFTCYVARPARSISVDRHDLVRVCLAFSCLAVVPWAGGRFPPPCICGWLLGAHFLLLMLPAHLLLMMLRTHLLLVMLASADSSHAAREQYLRRRPPCLCAFSPGSRPCFPCSLDFRSSPCFRLLQFFLRYRLPRRPCRLCSAILAWLFSAFPAPAPAPASLRLRLVTFPGSFPVFPAPAAAPWP